MSSQRGRQKCCRTNIYAQTFGQVRAARTQICPADLGDDLQQNLQEANDYKHDTVLHKNYQVGAS